MGLRDLFPNSPLRQKALRASPDVVQALHERTVNPNQLIAVEPRAYGPGSRISAAVVEVQSATYGWLYKNQPAVRTVVDYIARNVAQLGLCLYERTSDVERHEVSDHAAAQSLRNPNPTTPGEQFIFDTVASWLVYNNAYALKLRPKIGDNLAFVSLPPHMVGVLGMNRFTAEGYRVFRSDGTWFDLPPTDVLHWRGYDPEDQRKGISPLETLRKILAEEVAGQQANLELMKSGLAQPGWISRPLEAPDWGEEGMERFREDWANAMKNATRKTPVLEEGMEFKDFGISPKDAQMLAGREFTRDEVAHIYGMEHCPPQGAEEREQFLADVLPPITEMFASFLDLSVLKEEYQEPKLYFEFDLDEKWMANDRLTALTSAAGAPILTRNESRAMLNQPPKPGGDELITPLNVVVGGKPSPQVMPIQDPNKPSQDGSYREASNGHRKKSVEFIGRRLAQLRRRDKWALKYTEALRKHFTHQERSARSGKADPQPNAEGQNSALAKILAALMLKQIAEEGDVAAHRLMLPSFDMGQVQNFVKKVSLDEATQINNETAGALLETPATEVYEYAKTTRAEGSGEFFATRFSSFAHIEAAKQTPDASDRTKTWVVADLETSAHPEMDNQTVGLTEHFSNGKAYPPYEHPRCQCLVEIS